MYFIWRLGCILTRVMQPYPGIYEGMCTIGITNWLACEKSAACESVRHHFEECQERVTEGKGFEGEDCVEELYVWLLPWPIAVCGAPGTKVLTSHSPPGSLHSGVRCAVCTRFGITYMHSKLFAQLV